MDLHQDLIDLLSVFSSSGVDYLIVGGWAVALHGEPRFTKDLDLLVGGDEANLVRVFEALRLYGAPPRIVEAARSLRDDEFLFFGTAPARVDILRTIPGIEFASARARAMRITWHGVDVAVIGRDDLIVAKRAAGREQDLRDIRALLKDTERGR